MSTLLTVVLMGLLAGLLGVAVWTARGAAERTVCTMHLRQVANALIMYRTECGDYPPGYSEVRDSDGGIEIVTWEQALSSYLGKRQNLLECPAVARRDELHARGAGRAQQPVLAQFGRAARRAFALRARGQVLHGAFSESGKQRLVWHLFYRRCNQVTMCRQIM